MNNYDFPVRFSALYDKTVALYSEGRRGADTFFDAEENAWLAAQGLTAQHLYDYAEDHVISGEPGKEHALAIEVVRRDYFLGVQHGVASKAVLDEASLPPKTEAVEGVTWLPRLLPKTRAKLRGELPASLMFCCGGDRRFFKEHDILPAEFLARVWRHDGDDKAIVRWVKRA